MVYSPVQISSEMGTKAYPCPRRDSMISGRASGVCSGIARYFGVDPTLVRLITLLLIIPGGMSVWIYFIAALIMPKDCDC